MVLGFLWYSPLILGKPWMKLMGFTKEGIQKAQKEMGKLYFVSFVLTLVSGFVLSHVIVLSSTYYGYPTVSTGFISAFWMWIGFIMPVQVTSVIFGKEHTQKEWKLFGVNTGYQLVSLLAMGLIIGALM